jgi:hypothetical protein
MTTHLYEVGQRVSARMCNVKLGTGEIIALEFAAVPMYRVKASEGEPDATYPVYEDEVTPIMTQEKR